MERERWDEDQVQAVCRHTFIALTKLVSQSEVGGDYVATNPTLYQLALLSVQLQENGVLPALNNLVNQCTLIASREGLWPQAQHRDVVL